MSLISDAIRFFTQQKSSPRMLVVERLRVKISADLSDRVDGNDGLHKINGRMVVSLGTFGD